jgi:PPP family 3-phenylpropionic acid transporter
MTTFFPIQFRFRLYYVLEYAGVSIFFPYLALYFKQIRLTAIQAGILLALIPLVGFLAQPLWGLMSDIYGIRRTALILGWLGVAITSMAMGLTTEFHWLFLIVLTMAIMRGPTAPISTAMALDFLERQNRKEEFGSIRLWGSVSFCITALFVGAFLVEQAIETIVFWYGGLMFLLTLVTFTLPDTASSQQVNWRDGVTLLTREPVLATFLFGMLFVGITLGIANQYVAVYLKDIQTPGWLIGLSMSISALPEVPLMAIVPKLMARWGIRLTFLIGIGLLPLRWLLYAIISQPFFTVPVHVLHGFGLTALLVVGVIYMDRMLLRQWRATGQALYSASLFGIGPSIGVFMAGSLYERGGITPVWIFAMAVGLVGLAIITWATRTPSPRPVTESGTP